MTTNTSPRRFYAAATTNGHGRYEIIDRTDPRIVAAVKGRAAARAHAKILSDIDPADRPVDTPDVTEIQSRLRAHANCTHETTKQARAVCRRQRRAA